MGCDGNCSSCSDNTCEKRDFRINTNEYSNIGKIIGDLFFS